MTLSGKRTRSAATEARRLKGLFPAAIGIAVAFAATALASSAYAQSASAGKRVLLVESDAPHPYVAAIIQAFKARAASYGMAPTVQAAGFDAALQSRQMDDGIASNYAFIGVQAVSEQAIIPSLVRAKQAKIPVAIVNNPLKDSASALYATFVGQDQTEMGRIAGRAIVEALEASGRTKAKIALITGSLQEGAAPRRLDGIKQVLQSAPGVEIVAVEDAKWNTDMSERAAGELFARFASSGGLDLVYGMADNQAVATIRAAESAGIKVGTGPGGLIVLGGNCLKEGLDAIAAGKMFSSILQNPRAVGISTADAMNDYFSGKTLSRQILLPATLIKKDNLEKYRDACTY